MGDLFYAPCFVPLWAVRRSHLPARTAFFQERSDALHWAAFHPHPGFLRGKRLFVLSGIRRPPRAVFLLSRPSGTRKLAVPARIETREVLDANDLLAIRTEESMVRYSKTIRARSRPPL
jgi:hypothetical protein